MHDANTAAQIIDVSMDCVGWRAVEGLEALAHSVIAACVREAGLPVPKKFEVSLLFCDDAEIRSLNKAWRGKDCATNVLSFPIPASRTKTPRVMLGDIIIAFQTTAGEAERDGKSLRNHTAHLIAHGFLHLIGYDHLQEVEAETMENAERRILHSLGIADPYLTSA